MDCKKFESLTEKYLEGELHKKDIEPFEEHYFTCDKCFYFLKLNENLKEKRASIVLKEKRFPVLGTIFKPAMILSSFLIVFFSAFLFFNHRIEVKEIEKISSFSPPLFISSEIRSGNFNRGFENAMSLYKNSDFSGALKMILKTDGSSPKIIFFKGILHLLNKKPQEAITYFDEILNRMDPSYFDEAIYYKGIALLKLNEKQRSIEELKKLTDMYSPLSKKAKILIEKIKKL